MKLEIGKYNRFFSRYNDYTPDALFDGNTNTGVDATWNDLAYPAELPINLGGLVNLEKIRIFNGYGKRVLKIETALSLNIKELKNVVYNQEIPTTNGWIEIPVNKDCKWIFLTITGNKIDFPKEFEFYGTVKEELKLITPLPIPSTGKISKKSLGINSFFWLDKKYYSPFSSVRVFVDMNMMVNDDGEYTFENGSGAFAITQKLTELNALGIEPILCIQNTFKKILNGANNTNIFQGYPVAFGSDLSNPVYYSQVAKLFSDFAKYIKDKGLKCKIEWLNEPDAWWLKGNTRASFTPFEYAASFYAIHTAVKSVNPDMKILMGGLANPDNWGFIYGMYCWFKDNAGTDWLPENINFHRYCTNGTKQGNGTEAQDPTTFDLLNKTLNTISIIKSFLPNIPIDITEFGYGDGANQYSFKNVLNPSLVQGSNDILGIIILALVGIRTIYKYRLDDDLNAYDSFNSNGLLKHIKDSKGESWTPKDSYNLFDSFSKLLLDKEWSISINSDNTITLISGYYSFVITNNKTLKTISVPYQLTDISPKIETPVSTDPIVKTPTPSVTTDNFKSQLLIDTATDNSIDLKGLEIDLLPILTKWKLNKLNVVWKKQF